MLRKEMRRIDDLFKGFDDILKEPSFFGANMFDRMINSDDEIIEEIVSLFFNLKNEEIFRLHTTYAIDFAVKGTGNIFHGTQKSSA